ncbi:hypothetical protein M758_1G132800 [Ceratodon purpureus]|nr:hypothetical protein M758_1G132800 [Ceratodon purpureus]
MICYAMLCYPADHSSWVHGLKYYSGSIYLSINQTANKHRVTSRKQRPFPLGCQSSVRKGPGSTHRGCLGWLASVRFGGLVIGRKPTHSTLGGLARYRREQRSTGRAWHAREMMPHT